MSVTKVFHSEKFSSELAKLVPLPYSEGRCTRYFDKFMIFLLPFLNVARMSISAVSFLTQLVPGILSRLIECFPLTYDRSGFMSRINKYLLIAGSF